MREQQIVWRSRDAVNVRVFGDAGDVLPSGLDDCPATGQFGGVHAAYGLQLETLALGFTVKVV